MRRIEGVGFEIEVARLGESVPPRFALSGETARVVAGRGITQLHLSLSHDAGLAIAYVTAEASGGPGVASDVDAVGAEYVPPADDEADELLDVPEAEDPEEPR